MRRGRGTALVVGVMLGVIAPAASAQECQGPECTVQVLPHDFGQAPDGDRALVSGERSTAGPLLAIYGSVLAVMLVVAIAARRRGAATGATPEPAPSRSGGQRRKRPLTNAEWAAEMVARAKSLESEPGKLLASPEQVAFGGSASPPAGEEQGAENG